MVRKIDGMPPGTIGLEGSGELTKEDYAEVMEPALREGVERGEIRMLFRLTDFEGLGAGAWYEDLKTGLGLGYGHHSAWKPRRSSPTSTGSRRPTGSSPGSPPAR